MKCLNLSSTRVQANQGALFLLIFFFIYLYMDGTVDLSTAQTRPDFVSYTEKIKKKS